MSEPKTQAKQVRFVPLYLNGVRWKYAAVDLVGTADEAFVTCRPDYVSHRCRQVETHKTTISDFAKKVLFKRIALPIGPEIVEVGYYGVDHCLQVNETGGLTYGPPRDPEVRYGPMGAPEVRPDTET